MSRPCVVIFCGCRKNNHAQGEGNAESKWECLRKAKVMPIIGYPDRGVPKRERQSPPPERQCNSKALSQQLQTCCPSQPSFPILCRSSGSKSMADRLAKRYRKVGVDDPLSCLQLKRWGTGTGRGRAAGTCSRSSRRCQTPWGSRGTDVRRHRSCSTCCR